MDDRLKVFLSDIVGLSPNVVSRQIVQAVDNEERNSRDGRDFLSELIDLRVIPEVITPQQIQRLGEITGLLEVVIRSGIKADAVQPISSLLKIRPPLNLLDGVARTSATALEIEFAQRLAALTPDQRLSQLGNIGTVERVTQRFNKLNLDDARRLTLTQSSVYESLFLDAINTGKGNNPNDAEAALFDYILQHAISDDDALPKLLDKVIRDVVRRDRITVSEQEFPDLLSIAVADGLEKLQRQGEIPKFVNQYLSRKEINEEAVTESIKQSMIDYLIDLKLNLNTSKVTNAEFDEYFALAYDFARRQAVASDDPIDIARTRGEGVPSNFTIRKIREKERAFVRPEAVKAGGALFTIFVEGELLRLFEIADHLILDWHRGGLDIPSGKAAAQLNRYEHMRRDRFTEEERAMVYRRVFNFGQAELLTDTLINERFGEHFDNVMYEVTRLLDLQDRAFSDPRQISRAALFSAIESFQFNFSEFVTGSAFLKTTEMSKHLEEALDLITSEDVVAHYGGVRRTITGAIKNMGQKFMGLSLPVDDLLTLAERGNDVFQFISDFNRGSVSENDFQTFLDAAKETIIARAALGGEDMASLGQSPEVPDRRQNGNGYKGRNGYERNSYGRNGREENSRWTAGVGGRSDEIDEWDR
jgi:hypothetical protein